MSKGIVTSKTENNALAYASTGQATIDLFATVGTGNIDHLIEAWKEDKEVTTAIMFWARSVRNGAGRRLPLNILLSKMNYPDKFIDDNISLIIENGYWKDLIQYPTNKVIEYWSDCIKKGDALACKWAPRLGVVAKALTKACNYTNKEYRKHLKNNSKNVIEQYMCQKIPIEVKDFNWIPSVASQKYRKAFKRNYPTYQEWLDSSETKATAGAVYPYQIITLLNTDVSLAEKQWTALPNYIEENKSFIPLVDVSGSMSTISADNKTSMMIISIALGIYLSERCKAQFKNRLITFSESPELINLSGLTLQRKFTKVRSANWGMSTDFEKAYMLILDIATTWNLPQESLPDYLLVLSDMQFNQASNEDFTQKNIVNKFNEFGYKPPKMIYWNLSHNHSETFHSTENTSNVALVSGFSPSLMKSILKCEDITPKNLMYKTIEPFLSKINMTNLPDTINT